MSLELSKPTAGFRIYDWCCQSIPELGSTDDPLSLALEGVRKNTELAEKILGFGHPFVEELAKTAKPDQIRQSLEVTSDLLTGTIARWGDILHLTPADYRIALQNIVYFDFYRLNHIVVLSDIVGILAGNERPIGTKLSIPYIEVNTQPSYPETLQINASEAKEIFYPDDDFQKVFSAYRFPDKVPFTFIIPDDISTESLDVYIKTIIALAQGKGLSLYQDLAEIGVVGELIGYLDYVKKGLNSCSHIIFNPVGPCYAFPLDNMRDDRIMAVDIFPDSPEGQWFSSKDKLSDYFVGVVLSMIGHEFQHLEDFEKWAGLFHSMVLLEARGYAREYNYRLSYCSNNESLALYHNDACSYFKILQGTGSKLTPIERSYWTDLQQSLGRLDQENLEKLLEVINV